MSPEEYSTPRINFSSTNIKVMMSDKQAGGDHMYKSQMQEDNQKIVEEMSDYPKYTYQKKAETALKTLVDTQSQTAE